MQQKKKNWYNYACYQHVNNDQFEYWIIFINYFQAIWIFFFLVLLSKTYEMFSQNELLYETDVVP